MNSQRLALLKALRVQLFSFFSWQLLNLPSADCPDLYGFTLSRKSCKAVLAHDNKVPTYERRPWYIFSAQNFNFPQQFHFFCSLFLNFLFSFPQWRGRIRKSRLSKLHSEFSRCASLTKTVYLEFQCLQSYDHLLRILACKNQEDCHKFAGIEVENGWLRRFNMSLNACQVIIDLDGLPNTPFKNLPVIQ